eukprot:gene15879-18832_t
MTIGNALFGYYVYIQYLAGLTAGFNVMHGVQTVTHILLWLCFREVRRAPVRARVDPEEYEATLEELARGGAAACGDVDCFSQSG